METGPYWADMVHSVQQLRLIDLFAGCGGLTSGFMAAGGFRPVAAVENDFAAAATYAANFGEQHIHFGGIEDWGTAGDIPQADVVVGGPPCQGFSNLGHRRSDDARNLLWSWYVDVLVTARPQAFLLENVDQFRRSSQLRDLIRETEPGGRLQDYDIDHRIVRATDHGAAQLRKRTIVIGTLRDHSPILVPTAARAINEWKTVKTQLDGVAAWIDPDHQELPDRSTTAFGRPVAGVFQSPELHLTRKYSALSKARLRCIPPGGNRLDLPDNLKAACWLGHDKGSLDVMGRMHWDKPSVTIRTEFWKPEKGRYLHPEQHRAISHFEAARLQGFSDDYRWCGTKIQIGRQIGNAVPVELATSLAVHIRKGLLGR